MYATESGVMFYCQSSLAMALQSGLRREFQGFGWDFREKGRFKVTFSGEKKKGGSKRTLLLLLVCVCVEGRLSGLALFDPFFRALGRRRRADQQAGRNEADRHSLATLKKLAGLLLLLLLHTKSYDAVHSTLCSDTLCCPSSQFDMMINLSASPTHTLPSMFTTPACVCVDA